MVHTETATMARGYNRDVGQREIDRRAAEGEDMSRAYVTKSGEVKFYPPLPPMRNVGVMARRVMQNIIDQLPKSKLIISASDMLILIKHPKTQETIISCAHLGNNQWHMRACEGFITTTILRNGIALKQGA